MTSPATPTNSHPLFTRCFLKWFLFLFIFYTFSFKSSSYFFSFVISFVLFLSLHCRGSLFSCALHRGGGQRAAQPHCAFGSRAHRQIVCFAAWGTCISAGFHTHQLSNLLQTHHKLETERTRCRCPASSDESSSLSLFQIWHLNFFAELWI